MALYTGYVTDSRKTGQKDPIINLLDTMDSYDNALYYLLFTDQGGDTISKHPALNTFFERITELRDELQVINDGVNEYSISIDMGNVRFKVWIDKLTSFIGTPISVDDAKVIVFEISNKKNNVEA